MITGKGNDSNICTLSRFVDLRVGDYGCIWLDVRSQYCDKHSVMTGILCGHDDSKACIDTILMVIFKF